MTARALLAELAAAGIRVSRRGDDGLTVEARPSASLDPYRERITVDKPALLAELLKAAIIEAVTVAPERFDRAAYDRLWEQWDALEAAGASDAA